MAELKESDNRLSEQLKLQQEYNDALSFSKSMTSEINKTIKDQIKSNQINGKIATKHLDNLKSATANLQNSQDVNKKKWLQDIL